MRVWWLQVVRGVCAPSGVGRVVSRLRGKQSRAPDDGAGDADTRWLACVARDVGEGPCSCDCYCGRLNGMTAQNI